ncbi:hypothetical protein C0992_008500, partial [Termitomyces sp. T32_za158]
MGVKNLADTPEGDPTDEETSPKVSSCAENWKAAAKDENKKMWAIFAESGIFASACWHGFILWICDMIASGELAKYGLAMTAKALEVFQKQFLLAYDIGCTFGTTIKNSSLGPEFKRNECRTCVNAFHGYSHHYLCQLINHPNVIEGVGLEDLETLERIFSASNALGAITRYMTAFRRQVFIDLHFQHWDREKYANLANMLYQNYRQALQVIETNTLDVQHVLQLRNIQEADLDTYIADERNFFSTLEKETDGDLHAIAYVELLQELWITEAKLDDASSWFRMQTPANYQFVAPEQSYAINLSATRKADTARRQLNKDRKGLLIEILELEQCMNINLRWTPTNSQYQKMAEYVAQRKFEKALDHLQTLVIKRLFELHRLNLSQT